MAQVEDTRFGEVAVERGFITKPQLEDGLKALEFVTQAGLSRSLAEVLVEKGLLTDVQARIVSRATTSDEVQVIAGFELISKLGEGGMGSVYKARQISMDRLVALKTLAPHLAENREFTARFVREARTAAMLDHVNIVRGVDVGSEGDIHYFAMEFVEGESVGNIIESTGAIPEPRALRIIIQVARALEYAWDTRQIIHRDIKPDNILVTKGDIAKVADLGLARTTDNESTMMTQTGVAMGTPHYISPEQAKGEKDIDTRTDIYSLGATLYHMLTGETPFTGSSAMAVVTKHLTEGAVPVHVVRPEVSQGVSAVVGKMMAKEPAGRYATPTELLEDLMLVADGKKPKFADADAPGKLPSQTDTIIGPVDTPEPPAVASGGASRTLVFAAIGIVVVALGVVGAIFLTRGGGDTRPGPADPPEARAGLDEITRLVDAGDLDTASEKLAAAARVAAGGESADRLGALAKRIEALRAEADRAARRAKRESLQREAAQKSEEVRGLIAARRFMDARTSLQDAKARFEAADKADEAAALARDIGSAEAAYADVLVAEAAAHEKRREWNDAEANYKQALRHLSGGRRDDVRALLDGLDRRSKIEDLVAGAQRDARAKSWRKVWDAVGNARRSGIVDPRLESLAKSAASGLAPANRLTGPLGIEYVLVRGGQFMMGSADGEDDERPVHQATVSSFYIGRHEVTRSQFNAFRKGLRSLPAGAPDRKPVGSVSWQSAVDMCRYLSSIDPVRGTYRLPTETEWEYAARGTEGRKYPWGDAEPTPGRLNALIGGGGAGAPVDVGSRPAGNTPTGISDLAGNVFEWCSDWYGPYPTTPQDNPAGAETGGKRVARGGAYALEATASRSTLRGTRPPDKPLPMIGFRVVRMLTA